MRRATTEDVPIVRVNEPGCYTIQQDQDGHLSFRRVQDFRLAKFKIWVREDGSVEIKYSESRLNECYKAENRLVSEEITFQEVIVRIDLGLWVLPLCIQMPVWTNVVR